MVLHEDQPQYAARPMVTTLLMTDLVDSTKLVGQLGDTKAAAIFARQDRLARDLLQAHGGQEIDKTDGFLMLFARPVDAVLYALAYHEGLAKLSEELDTKLEVRTGIHLGELILHPNAPEDVDHGAKPVEVEGFAKPMTARIMSLALGGQTLMTQAAFDLARRGVVGSDKAPGDTKWLAHGAYILKGCDEPVEVCEVGTDGVAPLRPPPDTEKTRRSVVAGDEETLGWRPAAGLAVPQRQGWMLERKLGEGGFGEVWLALHVPTKERRVFKFCFDAARLRSLKRELTLFRLMRDALGDRKDIARLYEVQLEEPPFFLERGFTPSGSIVDWAKSQGGINNVPVETRLDMVARTARAVVAAHSVNILHKDIKPGNVLVYEDESGHPRPRLADFGIGTLTEEGKHKGRNITMAGFSSDLGMDDSSLATTRMYSPPELLAGKPFTVLGDIYALGVFLYQMVVGDLDRPLAHGWETDVQDSCLRDDIAECVKGDEEQRMGSAQGLAKRLETLPQRRRAARRRRLTRLGAMAALVLVVLLAVTGWLFLHERGLRRQITDQRDLAEMRSHYAKLTAAEGALRRYDIGDARMALDQVPKVHQGWEWHHLSDRLDQSFRTIGKPDDRLNAPVFSPNGRWIAVGLDSGARDDSVVGLWDASRLQEGVIPEEPARIYQGLPGRKSALKSIAFSPDERWVAAGYVVNLNEQASSHEAAFVQVWELETGDPLVKLRAGQKTIFSIAFSPDGSLLAATTDETNVSLWHTGTWQQTTLPPGHKRRIYSLAFSPDGTRLASASYDFTIKLWDVEDPNDVHEVATLRGHDYYVMSLSFRRDGEILASGSMDGTIKLWDVGKSEEQERRFGEAATGFVIDTLDRHNAWVNTVAFSPDGRYLASAGGDRLIRLWRVEDAWPMWERPLRRMNWPMERRWEARTLCGHTAQIHTVSFSPDGQFIASSSHNGTIKLWRVGADAGIPTLTGHLTTVNAVAFSATDPDVIASCDGEKTVHLWDIQRCEQIAVLWQNYSSLQGLAFHPKKALLAVPAFDAANAEVAIWDTSTEEVVHTLLHANAVNAVAFSPDGRRLAAAGGGTSRRSAPTDSAPVDYRIWLWDWEDEQVAKQFKGHTDSITSVVFSSNGEWLISGSDDGTVVVWDVSTGETIRTLEGHSKGVTDVAISSDGRWIASASLDQTVRLWDAQTGECRPALVGHAGRVNSVAFNPRGNRLVSSSDDSTLKVWDPQRGILITTLRDHVGRVTCVRWSPDGQRIASSATGWEGKDNTVKLWEGQIPEGVLRERAEAVRHRELVINDIERLFDEYFFAENVVEQINSDRWSEEYGEDAALLRPTALRLAGIYRDNPWWKLAGCWKAALSRHELKETYRQADRVGQWLDEYLKKSAPGPVSSAYGMALYRVGRPEEALTRLETALEKNGVNPIDLAFIVMCHCKLGNRDAAAATLNRLRAMIPNPESEPDRDTVALLREAEALIEGE